MKVWSQNMQINSVLGLRAKECEIIALQGVEKRAAIELIHQFPERNWAYASMNDAFPNSDWESTVMELPTELNRNSPLIGLMTLSTLPIYRSENHRLRYIELPHRDNPKVGHAVLHSVVQLSKGSLSIFNGQPCFGEGVKPMEWRDELQQILDLVRSDRDPKILVGSLGDSDSKWDGMNHYFLQTIALGRSYAFFEECAELSLLDAKQDKNGYELTFKSSYNP